MLRDLRVAVRSLRSWPFGAAAAILTLGVGIGAATSMFAFLRAALSGLPGSADFDTVGRIYASGRGPTIERGQLTAGDLQVLASASSFESVAGWSPVEGDLRIGPDPVDADTAYVSGGFFQVLRARAAMGRLFSAAEASGRGAPVAVVTDGFWRKNFAGQTLGGAAITFDGLPRTICGVLPPDFGYSLIGITADVWMPMTTGPGAAREHVSTIARLRSGTAWPAAQSELAALARSNGVSGGFTWAAIPVSEDVRMRQGLGTVFFFGPAFIVLLIGCTNVACMLLARGVNRHVELSVRGALGASRAAIVQQLSAEHVLLGIAGGMLGWGIAAALLRWIAAGFTAFRPEFATRVPQAGAVLALVVLFSMAACLLFGTLPALRLSRRSLAESLKGGSPATAGSFAGYRPRDLIVFFELGVAVALIVTTVLWFRLFSEMKVATPLFPANSIVGVEAPRTDAAAVLDRIRGLPGVLHASFASGVDRMVRLSAMARVSAASGRTTRASIISAGPDYFETLDLPIVRGRAFSADELRGNARVAVVSETARTLLSRDADLLGARLTIAASGPAREVVVIGICGDAMRMGALLRAGLAAPNIYVPFETTSDRSAVVLARAAGDARGLVKPVALAARISPAGRLPHAALLSDDGGFPPPESVFMISQFGGLALIALLLAASGIFGVLSQSVAQRTKEFGVRMAMGATGGQVLRLVLAREGKLIAAAIGAGAVATAAITRSAFPELLVLAAPDPRVWSEVMILCGGLAIAAVASATWRIVKLDPWKVLRDN
jgi:putative ABC transport system permease protein